MAAVSNSSPIIALARCGRLDLLRGVYERVLIPPGVRDEVAVGGPGSHAVGQLTWLQVQPIADAARARELHPGLGRGESEAIALALEVPGLEVVILDDGGARRRARALGLRVTGSAGVVVAAKARSLIPMARPVLDELRAVGFYLSDAAFAQALADAGE